MSAPITKMLHTFAIIFIHFFMFATALPPALHELPNPPHPWRVTNDAVSPDHVVGMSIVLKPSRSQQNAFEKAALEVADPSHTNYGKHFTREQVEAYFKPDRKVTAQVLSWLRSSGATTPISNIQNHGEWIDVQAPVHVVEKLLRTRLAWYTDGNQSILRTLRYSVGNELAGHVATIHPLTRFPASTGSGAPETRGGIHRRSSFFTGQNLLSQGVGPVPGSLDKVQPPNCNMTVGMTPACIKQIYNFNDDDAILVASSSKLGIAGYGQEFAKYRYLEQFLRTYAPEASASNATFKFQGIDGGLNDQNSTQKDTEANLDVQYGIALTYPLRHVTYYSTAGSGPIKPDLDDLPGSNPNEPFLETLRYMLQLPDKDLPQTLTTSYGEDEQTIPAGYLDTVCSMFARLGARGVSVIFASGDSGPGSSCVSNDGKNTTTFNPIFPASCPWVTSVGATYSFLPEIASPISSGGFSQHFHRPAWQDDDAEKYLEGLGDRWKGLYNPRGRAFPDVAAQGYDFQYVEALSGQTGGFSGTSAAAPTFAAVIARINAARSARGMPAMGFLNPWLYSVGRRGLNDITIGLSFGCSGTTRFTGVPARLVPNAGFNATVGWDPVTGLGTPDLGKMLSLATESHNKA